MYNVYIYNVYNIYNVLTIPAEVVGRVVPPDPGLSPDAVPGLCRADTGLCLPDDGRCRLAVMGRFPRDVVGRSLLVDSKCIILPKYCP